MRDVTCRFGGLTAISSLNFSVAKGELVGIIGPNGAGKTTIFNAITGLVRPTEGRVELHGRSLLGYKPHSIARRGVARSFQGNRLFASLTIRENVEVSARYASNRDSFADAVGGALAMFDLQRWAHRYPGELPWGVNRRAELARVYVRGAELMLLDEPAAGLNEAETEELVVSLKQIHASGSSMIIIEHAMSLILAVCERVVAIDHGVVIFDGEGRAMLEDVKVIEAYLGYGDLL